MTDTFVICRKCGSDACYENDQENSISWQCMDCGFYTSTHMLKNSDIVKFVTDTSPSLINDLAYEDEDGFIWFPRVVTSPMKGIIFPNGTSINNWNWTFAPEVIIPEDQRHRYPVKDKPGEFQTHRIAMENAKNYAQGDYILALEESGLLNYV